MIAVGWYKGKGYQGPEENKLPRNAHLEQRPYNIDVIPS